MTYHIAVEDLEAAYPALEPLFRKHYAEMKERLASQGIPIGEYAPRLDRYFEAAKAGYLFLFVVRKDGEPVGHSLIYLTNDMHNGELIGTEDLVYMLPEHRNGTGIKMTKFILAFLKSRGCKRATITTSTDLRVAKVLERIGFKQAAHVMTYSFEDSAHVRT